MRYCTLYYTSSDIYTNFFFNIQFDISSKLRERGWIVPAYTMAPNVEQIKMLRVVVREDFSRARCEILVRDIIAALHFLDSADDIQIEKRR